MVYSLDTNILLLDAHNLHTIGDNNSIIVIPETVLDELDSKKSVQGEIGYQAREFGRIMTAGEYLSSIEYANQITVVEYKVQDKLINIVSLREYPSYVGMERNVINDRKIIDATIAYSEVAKLSAHNELTFITNDIACGIRAQSLGLKTEQLREVDDVELEFTKEITVDSDTFKMLHNKNIADVDDNYHKGIYSYIFTDGNTGQIKPTIITNNKTINVIGKDTDKALQRQMVSPVNLEQKLASKAIQDTNIDIVLIEGLAGSGKNIIAVSNAIRLLQTNKDKYESIIYIRSPINDEELGEDIGYLSGNEEKMSIYLGPMEDTLDFLVRNNMDTKGKDINTIDTLVAQKIDKLVESCGMSSIITTGLRGRTFHNTILIVDEATNMSVATIQKVLTRIGDNCKLIVIGSQKQIDSKYVTKYNNGMTVLLEEAYNNSLEVDIKMFAIEFTKVKRSPIVEFAEKLFSKH